MATKLRMSVNADLGQRYAATLRRLKDAGRGDLARAMSAKIRRRAQPAVAAVRSSLRQADLPASPARNGRASSGLRDRAARAAAATTTRGGIRIEIVGKKVDPTYGTSLVLALNGIVRLRHPVFGNRSKWVQQRGSSERFYSALRPFEAQWRADVEQVMDEYVRQIEG